jgi:hypothetical protein
LVLVSAIALRVYRAIGKPLPAAIGVGWIVWLVIGYFTPRPVLFSLALLATLLLLADDNRLRWAIPLTLWIWSAVHGGFIVGLGFLVLDGLRRKDHRRMVDLAVGTGVTLVTAHGWGTWQIVMEFLGKGEALDLIVEWLTPNLISIELFPFALGIVALLIGAVRGRMKIEDLWVVIPFLLFAFTANRSVPISGLVLGPFFVSGLSSWRLAGDQATPRQSVLNLAALGVLAAIPWLAPISGGLDKEMFAVEALQHVQPGRLFHDDAVGGYLIYAQWPKREVYIDDRAELYGTLFEEFVKARGGEAVWRVVFQRYDLKQALLKSDDALLETLRAEGWIETYKNEDFTLISAPPPISGP